MDKDDESRYELAMVAKVAATCWALILTERSSQSSRVAMINGQPIRVTVERLTEPTQTT